MENSITFSVQNKHSVQISVAFSVSELYHPQQPEMIFSALDNAVIFHFCKLL
jgi:hypothetical protein